MSSVRFNDRVSYRKYGVKSFNKADVWWTGEEYQEMRSDISDTLELLQAGADLDLYDTTSRGLERLAPNEIERCRRVRQRAVDAVLDICDELWNTDCMSITTGEQDIARVYAKISKKCMRQASEQGSRDALEVASYIANSELLLVSDKKGRSTSSSSTQHKRRMSDATNSTCRIRLQ
jgi:hypothetical protein